MHCGIKAAADALDLAVLAADTPASAAALFTTNLAQAAPVTVSRRHIERTQGVARAVVVNSGCANACTGAQGLAHARQMAEETAAAVGCAAEEVLVASTGVIGVALKIERVVAGIQAAALALARSNGSDAARAIMTTDPFPKEHAVAVQTPRGSFTVGGAPWLRSGPWRADLAPHRASVRCGGPAKARPYIAPISHVARTTCSPQPREGSPRRRASGRAPCTAASRLPRPRWTSRS